MKSLHKATLFLTLCFGLLFAGAFPAAAAGLTDYAENKAVDALMRGQSLAAPASFWLGFNTDTCADAGNGTEPSGNGYSRIQITSSLANWAGTQGAGTTAVSSGTGAVTSNNATISLPTSTGAWGTGQSLRLYDASTSGNAWICINLNSTISVTGANYTVSFPAGSIVIDLDTD